MDPFNYNFNSERDYSILYYMPTSQELYVRVEIRTIISSLASCSSTLSDCVTFSARPVRAQ